MGLPGWVGRALRKRVCEAGIILGRVEETETRYLGLLK